MWTKALERFGLRAEPTFSVYAVVCFCHRFQPALAAGAGRTMNA